jgi:hypothetical protein
VPDLLFAPIEGAQGFFELCDEQRRDGRKSIDEYR